MHVGHTQFVLQQLRRAARPPGEAGDGELLDAFILQRDEAAFAALLRRHGPMVWGVCRRLAGQQPDAEDAFQAVFLILVRKANCVRPRERIGAWLHGVAFRTARKARRLAERRRAREKQVERVPDRSVESRLPDVDLVHVIDEELRRLPERLRLPVLLCDVEGRPQREVARELSVPVGTLGHRLDTARRLLARRLTRRGVTLSLAAIAATGLPASLGAVTHRAALGLTAGRELASLVPPQIVALTEGALTMTRSKFRLAGALLLVALLGGLGLNERLRPTLIAGENEPAKAPPAAKPAEAPVDDATFLRRISLDIRGTVPSFIEMNYFLADKDAAKRRKVVGWMLEPATAEQTAAEYWKSVLDLEKGKSPDSSHDMARGLAWLALQQAGAEPPPELKKETPAPAQATDALLKQLLDGKRTDRNTVDDAVRTRLMHWLNEKQPPPKKDETERARTQLDSALELLAQKQAQDESAYRSQLRRYYERVAEKVEVPDGGTVRLRMIETETQNDAEFLRRLMLDLLGKPPTTIEMNYFLADKDSTKRQKVLEWIVKNPDAAKKLETWKQQMSKRPSSPGRFETLLTELLASKRGDEQVLEALTLATLARFPTDSERQFLGAFLKTNPDRRAAWASMLQVLTNTKEFHDHAASLQSRAK